MKPLYSESSDFSLSINDHPLHVSHCFQQGVNPGPVQSAVKLRLQHSTLEERNCAGERRSCYLGKRFVFTPFKTGKRMKTVSILVCFDFCPVWGGGEKKRFWCGKPRRGISWNRSDMYVNLLSSWGTLFIDNCCQTKQIDTSAFGGLTHYICVNTHASRPRLLFGALNSFECHVDAISLFSSQDIKVLPSLWTAKSADDPLARQELSGLTYLNPALADGIWRAPPTVLLLLLLFLYWFKVFGTAWCHSMCCKSM